MKKITALLLMLLSVQAICQSCNAGPWQWLTQNTWSPKLSMSSCAGLLGATAAMSAGTYWFGKKMFDAQRVVNDQNHQENNKERNNRHSFGQLDPFSDRDVRARWHGAKFVHYKSSNYFDTIDTFVQQQTSYNADQKIEEEQKQEDARQNVTPVSQEQNNKIPEPISPFNNILEVNKSQHEQQGIPFFAEIQSPPVHDNANNNNIAQIASDEEDSLGSDFVFVEMKPVKPLSESDFEPIQRDEQTPSASPPTSPGSNNANQMWFSMQELHDVCTELKMHNFYRLKSSPRYEMFVKNNEESQWNKQINNKYQTKDGYSLALTALVACEQKINALGEQSTEVQEYIQDRDEIKKRLAQYYKIHLMPTKEEMKKTVTILMEHLQGNKAFADTVVGFKFQKWCNDDGRCVADQQLMMPSIVIYAACAQGQNALNNVFQLYRNTDIKGSGIYPRFNVKVNNLMYILQGNGDNRIPKYERYFVNNYQQAYYDPIHIPVIAPRTDHFLRHPETDAPLLD